MHHLKSNDANAARLEWKDFMADGTRNPDSTTSNWWGDMSALITEIGEPFEMTIEWEESCCNEECDMHQLPQNFVINKMFHYSHMNNFDSIVGNFNNFMDEQLNECRCPKHGPMESQLDPDNWIDRGSVPVGSAVCRGPTFMKEKKVVKWPHLVVFNNMFRGVTLLNLEEEIMFRGAKAKLIGAIQGNDIHYVAWAKKDNFWIRFDGLIRGGARDVHDTLHESDCDRILL